MEAKVSHDYKALIGYIAVFPAGGSRDSRCQQLVVVGVFVKDWCMHLITVKTHFATRENEARLSQKKRVDPVVRERGNPRIISNKEGEACPCCLL